VLAILLSHLREPEATAHFVGWLHALPIAAGHEFIGRAIQSVSGLSPHAIGLIELVAIVATSTFVPFEIWELWVRFTPMKLFAFAINVSIVAYLVWLLRREHAVREGFAPSKLQSRSQPPSSSS
jgi:hypothetical protein